MLCTSIPTNFTGSARPLKPRSGAVAIARSMASSWVASVAAFLRTRPEGLELSLHAARKAARKAAAMGRRCVTRVIWPFRVPPLRPVCSTWSHAHPADGLSRSVAPARRWTVVGRLGCYLVQPAEERDRWVALLLLCPALCWQRPRRLSARPGAVTGELDRPAGTVWRLSVGDRPNRGGRHRAGDRGESAAAFARCRVSRSAATHSAGTSRARAHQDGDRCQVLPRFLALRWRRRPMARAVAAVLLSLRPRGPCIRDEGLDAPRGVRDRLRHRGARDRPICHAQLIQQKRVQVGKTGDALLERGAESVALRRRPQQDP